MPTILLERTETTRTYRSATGRTITVPARPPRRLPRRLLPFGPEPTHAPTHPRQTRDLTGGNLA